MDAEKKRLRSENVRLRARVAELEARIAELESQMKARDEQQEATVRGLQEKIAQLEALLEKVRREPLQTSDAVGAAASQLGPEAHAAIAVLNKDLGLSHGKVARCFEQLFGRAWHPRIPISLLAMLILSVAATAWAGDAAGIYKRVLMSAVYVGVGTHHGSGALIDRENKLVLTACHVVDAGGQITVGFPVYTDGQLDVSRTWGTRCEVVARDLQRDLALLKLEALPAGAAALPLARQGTSPGQNVHLVGNPTSGEAMWGYTPGTVRQVFHRKWTVGDQRYDATVIQTNSAHNPGDSGGPLVNDRAELIGIAQGARRNAELMSYYVDLSEVKGFLSRNKARFIVGRRPPIARIADGGHFFSEAVVAKATDRMRDASRTSGRDLIVETYPEIPKADRERVLAMSRADQDAYFSQRARDRERDLGANGMFLVLWPTSNAGGYRWTLNCNIARSVVDANEIDRILSRRFREGKADDGLLDAVDHVCRRLSPDGAGAVDFVESASRRNLDAGAGAATAPVGLVHDDGKFFSAEAVQKANQRIQEIHREFLKTLLVETFPKVPADMEQQFQEAAKSPGGSSEFFHRWAIQRARAAGVNGIYVFLCREPPFLKIEADNETLKRAFTLANEAQLAKDMLALLKVKTYDPALLDAVNYVESTLRNNIGQRQAAAPAQARPDGAFTPAAGR